MICNDLDLVAKVTLLITSKLMVIPLSKYFLDPTMTLFFDENIYHHMYNVAWSGPKLLDRYINWGWI